MMAGAARSGRIDYFLGPDGEVMVEERYGQHSNRHEIIVKRKRQWNTVYNKKSELMALATVGITADYKNLVVSQYSEDTQRRQIYYLNLKNGKIRDSGLNREDRDIDRVITDVNRVFYGVQYSGFNPSYKMLDKKTDQLMQ